MALPPVLSEQGLARFRTKPCERLVANGCCTFGARCQYSHDAAWLRRNPHKCQYAPRLCAELKACALGADCGFAHSEEEVRFHPRMYKTVLCEARGFCDTYYCPHAHRQCELRHREEAVAPAPAVAAKRGGATPGGMPSGSPPRRRRGGRRGEGAAAETTAAPAHAESPGGLKAAEAKQQPPPPPPPPPPPLDEAQASRPRQPPAAKLREGGHWWVLDDQLRVAMVPESAPAEAPAGEALSGGRRVPGELRQKGEAEEVRCEVKLLPAGRLEHVEAARIVKELRRWMAFRGYSRALDIRRTVATVCLALPLGGRTLARSLEGLGRSLAQRLEDDWQLCSQAARWVRQLLSDLELLHEDGTAHLCISPATVAVNENGSLQLGDFLGKIRALSRLARGWGEGGRDDAWAMWHPAEVHEHIEAVSQGGSIAGHLTDADHFAIDLWQLGVTVFFMLTGEHLFGDVREPAAVCENILEGRPANLPLLAGLPLFSDFVDRLTATRPQDRPHSCSSLDGHPLCWSLGCAAAFAAPTAADGGVVAGLLAAPPGLDLAPDEAQRSVLRHLPCLAPLGGPEPPSASCEPLLRALRVQGSARKEAELEKTSETKASDRSAIAHGADACTTGAASGGEGAKLDASPGRVSPEHTRPCTHAVVQRPAPAPASHRGLQPVGFATPTPAVLRLAPCSAAPARCCSASASPAGSSTSSTTASRGGSPHMQPAQPALADIPPMLALEELPADREALACGASHLRPFRGLFQHFPEEELPGSKQPAPAVQVRAPPGLLPPPGLGGSLFNHLPAEFLLDGSRPSPRIFSSL